MLRIVSQNLAQSSLDLNLDAGAGLTPVADVEWVGAPISAGSFDFGLEASLAKSGTDPCAQLDITTADLNLHRIALKAVHRHDLSAGLDQGQTAGFIEVRGRDVQLPIVRGLDALESIEAVVDTCDRSG